MKYVLFLVFIIAQFSYGQSDNSNNYMVIATKSNVRDLPSLEGNVIGVINQGEWINESELDLKKDVVNDKEGYWIPIKINNKIGYIWDHTLTSHIYTSVVESQYKTLFKLVGRNELRIVTLRDSGVVSDSIHRLEWLNTTNDYLYISYYNNLAAYPGKELFQLNWYNKEEKSQNYYVIEVKDSNIVFTEEHKVVDYANLDFMSDDSLYFIINPDEKEEVFITDYPDDHPDTLKIIEKDEVIIKRHDRRVIQYEGMSERWIPIKYNNINGYIDAYYIEKPSQIFNSIYDNNIKYGVSDKFLYYYNSRKLIAKVKIKDGIIPEHIKVVPTSILSNVDEIISLSYYGESCGVPSGELVYTRQGEHIEFLFHNESMGDGGYGTEVRYSLIGQDSILEHSSENEYLMVSSDNKDITSDYNFGVFYQLYEWTNNKIEPLDSKYEILRKLVEENDWSIDNQFYFDINKDGLEDIVGVFRSIEEDADGYIKYLDEVIVVIYLQTIDGEYELYGENHSMYKKGYSATEVSATNKGVKFEIYYAEDCIGCVVSNVAEDYGYKAYDFKMKDSTLVLQQTKWISKSDFENIDNLDNWTIIKKDDIEFKGVK